VNDAERLSEIADEVAVERQYSEGLKEKERRRRRMRAQLANNTWTENLATDPVVGGEFVGRIRLARRHDLVEAEDFYIGTERFDGDTYRVFPWTAPIAARTFYRQGSSSGETKDELDEMCADVVGVRAFTHHLGEINDLHDEWLDGTHRNVPMFQRAPLSVPRAPSPPPAVAPPPKLESKPDTPPPAQPIRPAPDRQQERRAVVPAPSSAQVSTPTDEEQTAKGINVAPSPPGRPLRAPDLLRRQLAAPKEAAMSAVLATLQADQYEAITALATEDQILQGHPGTGKTIIAVHRAAYLLSPHDPSDPDNARARGRVLVIGPTDEYVAHVGRALRTLVSDAELLSARSLPGLLEELASLPVTSAPTEAATYLDVDLGLAGLVDQAFKRAMAHAAERPTAASVYSYLVGFLKDPPDGVLEPEWADYLRSLPPDYADLRARRLRRHRGLMAYIGVRTTEDVPRYGHIIVDEAQDIHPIEWETLSRLRNDGGWTILGDLNQRRTDYTFPSWARVAERLAIDVDGVAPVKVLDRGYRSTAQIIQFANQLLPKEERILHSLQAEGEWPDVRRVAVGNELFGSALSAAADLLKRVAPGTVAIIAADHERMRAHMVRKGWKTDGRDGSIWLKDDQALRVLPAERARGLEFDAVVVVEPAGFPELFGRKGVLYTALTRANKLLTVVHHRALPVQLKARRA